MPAIATPPTRHDEHRNTHRTPAGHFNRQRRVMYVGIRFSFVAVSFEIHSVARKNRMRLQAFTTSVGTTTRARAAPSSIPWAP